MDTNTASFVGNIPEQYDRGLGPVIFVDCARETARRVAEGSPARVLETACGTGIVTRALRDALPPTTQLTATDLNPPMLEVARARFRADEQVTFEPVDATKLPYPDGSFDAVVCQFGVMFYPDKDKSFREVFRVLTPGGRYIFSSWDSLRWNAFGRILDEVVNRFFPVDPPQFQTLPYSYGFEAGKASLIEAGFIDVAVNVWRYDKEIADVDAFARGLVCGNPLIDQVRARGGVDPERMVEAVAQELVRASGTQPPRTMLQALVFSARRPG